MRVLFIFLAAVALAGSTAEGRDLGSIGPLSSGFRDDAWVGGAARGTQTSLPRLEFGVLRCSDRLTACVREIQSRELLTSTAADASANTTTDLNGHALSVSGLVVIERIEASAMGFDLGIATTWSVEAEQALDDVGERQWEMLVPDSSPNARWLPIQSYGFESHSPVVATLRPAIPEPPPWALLGLGFAALGSAASRARRRLASGLDKALGHRGWSKRCSPRRARSTPSSSAAR